MANKKGWEAKSLGFAAIVASCSSPAAQEAPVRNCSYTNPFTETPECREYHGDWAREDASAECEMQAGVLAEGVCTEPATLGQDQICPFLM